MPYPKRLEFVTRHFKDLQTIRFAPVPAAMLLAPLMPPAPLSRGAALAVLLGFLSGAIGFYWWSTVAIKRRYGSVRLSRDETQRMQSHPAIFALYVIMGAAWVWLYFFAPRAYRRAYSTDIYCAFILLSAMLRTILDSTNPARRRVVWAIGLVVLFGAGPFLIAADGDVAALGGAVWLSISIFDFLLLRRTFAEISASPSHGATDVVAHYG